MINNSVLAINNLLALPSLENILSVFDPDGYVRLNMLYLSPVALKHLREFLLELGLVSWSLTDSELVFRFEQNIVSFRGALVITMKDTKVFSVELDFDPIISDASCTGFLKEIEIFLKQCDACFFMSYSMSIDAEILNHPLSESIGFLATRKC